MDRLAELRRVRDAITFREDKIEYFAQISLLEDCVMELRGTIKDLEEAGFLDYDVHKHE